MSSTFPLPTCEQLYNIDFIHKLTHLIHPLLILGATSLSSLEGEPAKIGKGWSRPGGSGDRFGIPKYRESEAVIGGDGLGPLVCCRRGVPQGQTESGGCASRSPCFNIVMTSNG
jgi:hypothetical protein